VWRDPDFGGLWFLRQINRQAAFDIQPDQIDAILLTHEHSDHVAGVGAVARQLSVPVWMTPGTFRKASRVLGELPEYCLFDLHDSFEIGEIEVRPYPVPHDAGEPSQFVFCNGSVTLGLLTDAGSITRHMQEMLSGCDALILECNHDRDMLLEGDYPSALKARVDGSHGHLSNDAAGALLEEIETDQLQHIVAAHLSEKNNTTWLARTTLASALNCDADWVAIADQENGRYWRDIV
jgi:phosphoribosyl 1,2-cyclic phosphodiesterase